jgi:outer membrane protein assembly factor BamB
VGSANSSVSALNMYDGQPSWHFPTSGPVNSGPATDGSTVYVGDDDGYVYAIDVTATTPALRWRFQAGRAVRSQILLADGVVYFGSLDHYVYALPA